MNDVRSNVQKMPEVLNEQAQKAKNVVQRHRHVFQSQSSSLTSLQDQIIQLKETLHDITERHDKEKKRRQELHNTLMVKLCQLSPTPSDLLKGIILFQILIYCIFLHIL